MRGDASIARAGRREEAVVTRNRKIGIVIVLSTAISAATGLILGILHIQPAVGTAVVGIVIGTAVARGAFSDTPKKGNDC